MARSLFQPEAPALTHFVRVVVERGIDQPLTFAGEEGLTYGVEGDLPCIGQRVRVPLRGAGRARGREATAAGYVVKVGGRELLEGLSEARVKLLGEREPLVLSGALLDLARWMSQYYLCPLGMVLATMTPAAVKADVGGAEVELLAGVRAGAGEGVKLSTKARQLLDALQQVGQRGLPVALAAVATELGLSSVAPLRRLAGQGVIVIERQRRVQARAMEQFERVGAPAQRCMTSAQSDRVASIQLTGEQRCAVDSIEGTGGMFRVHVLRGVTGSGKTEVYLQCIARVLERGQGAIVLVPEIALTPQTSHRFIERFGGDTVAVLHSGLTSAQRNREWRRVLGQQARVVVGARSAVFAPMADLGLIVVDEEHDASYKQDQLPRYHARDVAIKRAQGQGCPVVLGSATPSLESWSNALAAEAGGTGRFGLLTMRTRATGAEMPRVQVVDMVQERRERERDGLSDRRRQHMLGPTLERAMERALGEGAQVLLLLNRRGFAHHLACPSAACGFVVGCEQCSVKLVLHKDPRAPAGSIVRCHQCLTEQRVAQLCPLCSRKLVSLGGGTQRLEEEVEQKFASLGVRRAAADGKAGSLLRLDSDTMQHARDYFEALSRFARGQARVMLGTQMIAKGLDFPGVRLVGIVDADTALQVPDFRSGERTFQLITQAAGRAGRQRGGGPAAQVIVQTLSPSDGAIVHASTHDFESFARQELAARAQFGLPPARRMARIVCRDTDQGEATARSEHIAAALRDASPAGVEVIGPAACNVERIANFWRMSVEVFAPSAAVLMGALLPLRRAGVLKSDARTAIDVDPVSLM